LAHRVADELVTRLAKAGVERIYGIVGDSLNPVTDAIHRNGKIKWIHVRHESLRIAGMVGAMLLNAFLVATGKAGNRTKRARR
jgi:pyruvate dehydrogenase (quinone)